MKKELLPVLLLMVFIIIAFFSTLFLPQPKLFYTPDFGRSDIWHFNYPLKDLLASSLKKGRLPFWNAKVGTGFPFLAEGQIGALNLSNLILFFLFPTWLAWNLSYCFIFFIAFLGTYLFLRKNSLSPPASFLAGFLFSFGGFFVCHIPHFNLIQAAAFLPWLFFTGQNLWQRPSKINFFFFAFVFAQQIFSGHPQIVFISLLGLISFPFLSLLEKKKNPLRFKKTIIFILGLIFGLSLAAPQLLPTLELIRLSPRRAGLDSQKIFAFPYPYKHLLTFFLPDFFGTPKNGSYPVFSPEWGIYWENTAYLGLLPLVFALLAFFSLFFQPAELTKKPLKKFFFLLFFFSLLLVLGKDSPLYFLFTFPGFNYFFVPSRFLLLTSFSLSVLAAFGFDQSISFFQRKIRNKKILFLLVGSLVLAAIVNLFFFGFRYHPLATLEEALTPPESLSLDIQKARIYTPLQQLVGWNDFFISRGWQTIEPYLYFKNGLNANLNLLFNQANVDAFYGLPSSRQSYYQESLKRKLINAAGAKYFLSPTAMEEEGLTLTKTIEPHQENLPQYFIYQNQQGLDRFRFASRYQIVKTLRDFSQIIEKEDFSFEKTALLENDPREDFEELSLAKIEVVKEENQELVLVTETDKKTILVIADSFYPGWQAKIDNQKREILPANLNQRALILPSGRHLVEMSYSPQTFYWGLILATASLFFYLCFPRGVFKISPPR
jgi:hypothetical protein